MTVCIAVLFRWNYSRIPNTFDWGTGAITASDRMITFGDVEYEPQQTKLAQITPHTVILIAGDYTTHSQALARTHSQVKADPTVSPHSVAQIYSSAIQAVQRKEAEDRILAPLGLNTDTFMAQQKEFSEGFVDRISSQLQDWSGVEVDALVIGFEGKIAHIYEVDRRGTVRSFDDVGFDAIGIGAWHAKSRLMQYGYVNTWNLAPALSAVFGAKKAAETAPGVGKHTDIHILLRHGGDRIDRMWPKVATELEELYGSYDKGHAALLTSAVDQLQEFLNDPKNTQTTAETGTQEGPESATTSASTVERDRATEGQSASEGAQDAASSTGDVQGQEP